MSVPIALTLRTRPHKPAEGLPGLAADVAGYDHALFSLSFLYRVSRLLAGHTAHGLSALRVVAALVRHIGPAPDKFTAAYLAGVDNRLRRGLPALAGALNTVLLHIHAPLSRPHRRNCRPTGQ